MPILAALAGSGQRRRHAPAVCMGFPATASATKMIDAGLPVFGLMG
jgi:hypothetical protein